MITLLFTLFLLSAQSYSSDKMSEFDSSNSQNLEKIKPVVTQLKDNISCYYTSQTSINSWPRKAISENWFDLDEQGQVIDSITYIKPGLGCIIQNSKGNKKYYLLKDPDISCYFQNFVDGPNENFEAYCVNYREQALHRIKIYLRNTKTATLHGFNLISEQPNESVCACALALSANNTLAISARNINPVHTPFSLFSINLQNNKPRLTPIGSSNNANGLYFVKLTFTGEQQLVGLQNTGHLILITYNADQSIRFKKIRHQKKIWPAGLKDFTYEKNNNELITLDAENNVSINTLSEDYVITKHVVNFQNLKLMMQDDNDEIIDIQQIKAHKNKCCLFVTMSEKKTHTYLYTVDTDQLNTNKNEKNDKLTAHNLASVS